MACDKVINNVTKPLIILATPHARHDVLVKRIELALPGYHVCRIRSQQELNAEYLRGLNPSLVFLPHWSWIIPSEIYERFECIVFHMTDLPYGRGGSPLQNLIVRGHSETMLTALKCVAEIDGGPVYMKLPLSLSGTAEEILSRASELMEGMIIDIVTSRPLPVPQSGTVTVFKRRRPAEGDLAQLTKLSEVYDYIRMLDADGYPRAFLATENLVFEFGSATMLADGLEAKVRVRLKDERRG